MVRGRADLAVLALPTPRAYRVSSITRAIQSGAGGDAGTSEREARLERSKFCGESVDD